MVYFGSVIFKKGKLVGHICNFYLHIIKTYRMSLGDKSQKLLKPKFTIKNKLNIPKG